MQQIVSKHNAVHVRPSRSSRHGQRCLVCLSKKTQAEGAKPLKLAKRKKQKGDIRLFLDTADVEQWELWAPTGTLYGKQSACSQVTLNACIPLALRPQPTMALDSASNSKQSCILLTERMCRSIETSPGALAGSVEICFPYRLPRLRLSYLTVPLHRLYHQSSNTRERWGPLHTRSHQRACKHGERPHSLSPRGALLG